MLHDSHSQQQLYSYTVLTDLYNADGVCSLRVMSLRMYCIIKMIIGLLENLYNFGLLLVGEIN
jgi:hypothetical protein